MSSDRQRLAQLTLDELADALAGPEPGSRSHNLAMAELSRRQMVADLENTIAQKNAVIAQNRAAAAAERNTRYMLYMLWSVIVLAVSSLLNLLIALYQTVTAGQPLFFDFFG
jgi:lipopolysaccharide/colanic/teichoic acid biosynthesis glycosyltransferase